MVVKLGCWLWSRSIKNSGVQALAQDAMNDVIFKYRIIQITANSSVFSLIFPLAGYDLEVHEIMAGKSQKYGGSIQSAQSSFPSTSS